MLAVAFYRDVLAGRKKRIGSFHKDERDKFAAPGCMDFGAERVSLDHLVPPLAGAPGTPTTCCRHVVRTTRPRAGTMWWRGSAVAPPPRRRAALRQARLVVVGTQRTIASGPLDDVAEMPFDLDALVAAPKRTGVGEDDGRWTMRWE